MALTIVGPVLVCSGRRPLQVIISIAELPACGYRSAVRFACMTLGCCGHLDCRPGRARTPLTIVAHILPGHRIVICPTLAAIGSISGARTHGADACLSTAEPAITDVHRTADVAEPHGEGRGCNC